MFHTLLTYTHQDTQWVDMVWLMSVCLPLNIEALTNIAKRLASENLAFSSKAGDG